MANGIHHFSLFVGIGAEMEIAIVASLLAEGNMDVDA